MRWESRNRRWTRFPAGSRAFLLAIVVVGFVALGTGCRATKSVMVGNPPPVNTTNQTESPPRDFQDPLNEPSSSVSSHDGKWQAYSVYTEASSLPTMYLVGDGVKLPFVGALPYAFSPDDALLLFTQKPSWEDVGGLTVVSIPPTGAPRLLINKEMKEIGGPTPPGYITDPLDSAAIQWRWQIVC